MPKKCPNRKAGCQNAENGSVFGVRYVTQCTDQTNTQLGLRLEVIRVLTYQTQASPEKIPDVRTCGLAVVERPRVPRALVAVDSPGVLP